MYPLVLTSHGQDEFKFGRSSPRSAGWSIPPVLTSCGQDQIKLCRSTTRSTGRCTPWYWHLLVKVSSNLADLPLDLLTDLHPSTDILWSRWFQIWQIYPPGTDISCKMISNLADIPLLTSHGQDEFKFGRSTPRSAFISTPWYIHLVVKMISNLADLPLDLLADLPPWYWHLMVKMSSNLADLPLDLLTDQSPQYCEDDSNLADPPQVLTSCGQDEFKFGRSTPRSAGRSTPLVLTSRGQGEFKFGRSTPRSADRSTPQYWHLVVKMISNLADLPPWYWHLMVKMSSNLADLPLDMLADLHP